MSAISRIPSAILILGAAAVVFFLPRTLGGGGGQRIDVAAPPSPGVSDVLAPLYPAASASPRKGVGAAQRNRAALGGAALAARTAPRTAVSRPAAAHRSPAPGSLSARAHVRSTEPATRAPAPATPPTPTGGDTPTSPPTAPTNAPTNAPQAPAPAPVPAPAPAPAPAKPSPGKKTDHLRTTAAVAAGGDQRSRGRDDGHGCNKDDGEPADGASTPAVPQVPVAPVVPTPPDLPVVPTPPVPPWLDPGNDSDHGNWYEHDQGGGHDGRHH